MNTHRAPEDLISRLRQAGLHDRGVRHFDEGGSSDGGGTSAAMGGVFGDDPGMDAALAAAAPAAQATSTNGMTMGELSALAEMGGGDMDISDTQNVYHAIASLNTSSMLSSINPATIASMVAGPVAGMAMNAISGITAAVNSGMSFAEAVASMGQGMALSTVIGAVAQSLGLPSSVVTGVVNGNIGNALSGSVTTGIISAVASAMGIPSSAAAIIGNITGMTAATNSAISSAINGNQGVAGVNSAISGITAGVNNAISGVTAGLGLGGGSQSAGVGGASGSGATANAGNVGGMGSESNSAASNQAADPANVPTPTAAAQRPPTYTAMGTPQEQAAEADIFALYDPFGESIFQKQRPPKSTAGSLKSAYNIPPSLRAAEGGSIDDLMDYLRN